MFLGVLTGRHQGVQTASHVKIIGAQIGHTIWSSERGKRIRHTMITFTTSP